MTEIAKCVIEVYNGGINSNIKIMPPPSRNETILILEKKFKKLKNHNDLLCRQENCGYDQHRCSQCQYLRPNSEFGYFKMSRLRKRQGECCKWAPRNLYKNKK